MKHLHATVKNKFFKITFKIINVPSRVSPHNPLAANVCRRARSLSCARARTRSTDARRPPLARAGRVRQTRAVRRHVRIGRVRVPQTSARTTTTTTTMISLEKIPPGTYPIRIAGVRGRCREVRVCPRSQTRWRAPLCRRHQGRFRATGQGQSPASHNRKSLTSDTCFAGRPQSYAI